MNDILLQIISTPQVQTLAAWLLPVLIVSWVALRAIGGGRLLAFNNSTGRVLVARSAIKGLIARTCQTIEGIAHPQSRIFTSGGKLRVRVYIQLRGNSRLSDIGALIQEKLDMALRQNLGLERIGKIDVVVTDIQPTSKGSKATAKAGYPWTNETYGE
jgi:uncharacterized alkaline shock family protein YloU